MSTKTKYLAGSSLAVMGVGFAATMPFQQSDIGYVLQSGFEAGLVGGLADWFAVTALFRYPLGLPIPHTALLPKNRKRVTKALVSTLENEWLTKESIIDKVKQVHITERALDLVENALQTQSLQTSLISILKRMIYMIPLDKAAALLEKEIKAYASSLQTKELLVQAVDYVLQKGYDEKVFDYILVKGKEAVLKEETKRKLGKMATDALDRIELDGILQFALNSLKSLINEDKLGHIIQGFILKGLSSIEEPTNENRLHLLGLLRGEIEKVKENETLAGEMERWKEQFIHSWNAQEQITAMLQRFQQKAIDFVDAPSFATTYLSPFLLGLLRKMREEHVYVEKIESWVQEQIAQFVDRNHEKIGRLVQENLDRLTDERLIEMIENNVGKDLQWIRVNGAVCGFMIGLVLGGVKLFLQ